MNAPLWIKVAIGVAGYGVWALMAYLDPAQRPDFLKFNIALAVGTIGLVVRDMQAPATPAAPPDKQAGHAFPALLPIVAIGAAAVMLSGCAGFAQVARGYEASAAQGLRATEDNNISVWEFNVCATPFSAAVRHPEIIAAMRALCLPTGAAGSPSALLDAVPVAK